MSNAVEKLGWLVLAVIGAVALGVVALNRGETVNAVWLVVAAVCTYLVAYRFYSLYIAETVLRVDPTRPTPAVRYNDGLDYVPTDKYVLFGHHFAAIAGAGPLVGPVLAAQMGYLPGTLWILVGAVFAGCEDRADQDPERARQVAHLRGEDGPDEWPGAGDGGEVVAEQDVLVGRDVVEAIIVADGGRRASRID